MFGDIPITVTTAKAFRENSGNATWTFSNGTWCAKMKRSIPELHLRAGQQFRFKKSRSACSSGRLKEGSIQTLYHQTNEAAARKILASQRFRPGSHGMAGPGIYFATSKNHTSHKTTSSGVILQAQVQLGRIAFLDKHGDKSLTRAPRGYDSVCIDRDNGQEFVIYDTNQVKSIEIAY
jgi:hypothetical protein